MPDVKVNKYRRPIPARAIRNGGMDVYDVLAAFAVTCPAVQHAVKKLLCAGLRGHKDMVQDLVEAAWSVESAVEMGRDASGIHLPHETPMGEAERLAMEAVEDARRIVAADS